MRIRDLLALALVPALLPMSPAVAAIDGRDDVVVVAVIDDGFSPYHYDFRASQMPQHLDADPTNDLPLDQPPHTWIPGFPDPSAFFDYKALDLTLPGSGGSIAESISNDTAEWARTYQTVPGAFTSYYWAPGTKVVGVIKTNSGAFNVSQGAHGTGSTSVSTGNIYGTCAECVLVFVQYDNARNALIWATEQPWIDVITNSYGQNLTAARDNINLNSPVESSRDATVRGQEIFWSSGNGLENAFVVPATTYTSAQKGPDWIMTVGAVTPGGAPYSGAGKMVDVASVGSSYPASIGASTVDGGGGNFSGTSNATPVSAGVFARGLSVARTALGGPSKIQSAGVVATGVPVACGTTRPDCELGDGTLTRLELQNLFLKGAAPTTAGISPGGAGSLPKVGEDAFISTGHGSYFGKSGGLLSWTTEFDRALREPMLGLRSLRARPAGESDWMKVDSYCRQRIWGPWDEGAYLDEVTPLPDDDVAFPVRSTLRHVCPSAPRLA